MVKKVLTNSKCANESDNNNNKSSSNNNNNSSNNNKDQKNYFNKNTNDKKEKDVGKQTSQPPGNELKHFDTHTLNHLLAMLDHYVTCRHLSSHSISPLLQQLDVIVGFHAFFVLIDIDLFTLPPQTSHHLSSPCSESVFI